MLCRDYFDLPLIPPAATNREANMEIKQCGS